MEIAAALKVIDLLILGITTFTNAIGAGQKVSDAIAARIKSGAEEWTDAQRKAITDDLKANKAYAKTELDKPD